ncbi:hypothetical protein Fot_38111 [Forsythia ovata]|uniref:Uncharacterized protein n=1 Tax=Forsythia ovata TaxID=205694 RepID=A0ABD1S2D5_9LAMI
MTIGGEQLVEQIAETHPEWDISFLRQAHAEAPVVNNVPCEANDHTSLPVVEEGPQFPSPDKAWGDEDPFIDIIGPVSPKVPFAVPVPGATVLQTPEAVVGNFSFISPVPAVTSEVPSTLFSAGPTPLPKSSRQSGKRKAETDGKEGTFRTSVLSPVEYINIGSRWDKLDPIVLEKLPASASITVASVYKYWTSAFEKAADNVELTELLKLAEMYTSQSHVLNCELYKILAMKVDELSSTVGGMRILTHYVQRTRIFGNIYHSLRTRGLVLFMTLPNLRQSRRHVYRLIRRSNRN